MSIKSVEEVIAAAVEQESDKENPERRSIPWEDGTERLLVVNLPLDLLLLNPHSHRIKAQLSAHPESATVEADPFTDRAQAVIADLLRRTEGYEDLKTDLAELQQREPGVATREGILVNANTRAVAMRELGMTHIRVMVLPPKTTPQQVAELELRLQVSRDYKQDYTFTNRLLFVEDCRVAGWDNSRIAREIHGTSQTDSQRVAKVNRDLRVLALVEELIEMSGRRLGYPDFDDKATALEELDRDYQDLKDRDAAAALRLRSARLVAILSGVGYREIRHIGDSFVAEYLQHELDDDEELKLLVNEDPADSEGDDSLDLLGGDDAADIDKADALLRWLTDTAGQPEVELASGDTTISRPRSDVVENLQTAVESAVAGAKADKGRGDLLERTSEQVAEAVKRLRAAESAYGRAVTDVQFIGHVPKVRDRLAELRRAADSLDARLAIDFPEDAAS